MECFTVLEDDDSHVVAELLNPTPTPNATTRHFLCEAALCRDRFTPFALDLRPLLQSTFEMLGSLHRAMNIRYVS